MRVVKTETVVLEMTPHPPPRLLFLMRAVGHLSLSLLPRLSKEKDGPFPHSSYLSSSLPLTNSQHFISLSPFTFTFILSSLVT